MSQDDYDNKILKRVKSKKDTLTDEQREEIRKMLKKPKNCDNSVKPTESSSSFQFIKKEPTPKQVCFYKYCCCCLHCCGNKKLAKCTGCCIVTFCLILVGCFMYGFFLAFTEKPVLK
jgi:hypothetical protein